MTLSLVFYFFFVFFQLCILRPALILSNHQLIEPIILLAFLPALWLFRSDFKASKTGLAQGSGLTKPLFLVGLLSIGYLILFSLNDLSLPMHVRGDEDHHFETAQGLTRYAFQYLEGTIPNVPAPGVTRYPSLIHFISIPFLNPVWNNFEIPWAQRLPLAFVFISFTGLIFYFTAKFTKDSVLAVLISLSTGLAPLLLTFVTDKYLDIGHPILMLASIWYFIESPEDRPWSNYLKSGIFAALAFFVRDNVFPFTMIMALVLTVNAKIQFKTFIRPLKIFLLITLPVLTYLYIKRHGAYYIDAQRLSWSNIGLQNYKDFFSFLFLYFPPPLLIFSMLGFYFFLKKRLWLNLIATSGSLLALFFLYSIFEPGWMPWTRNYLMFYGLFLGPSLFAIRELIQTGRRKSLIYVVLGCGLATNLAITAYCFNDNRFFHENENLYIYDQAFHNIEIIKYENPQLKVALHIPESTPLSFFKSLEKSGLTSDVFVRIEKEEQNSIDGQTLLFKDFETHSRPYSYLLFQYRIYEGSVPILKVIPTNPRPTTYELSAFEVISETVDPWSHGRTGVLLLKRKSDQ